MAKVGTIMAVIAAGAVATAVVVANSGSDPVTVVRVIDGDTLDARVDGEDKRIRLLNVDTPEMGHDGAPDDCLAAEATSFLQSLLPVGSEISLQYDQETTDRYGRELAGVFAGGTLVNAQIAREGFGVAVQYGGNNRFYSDVAAAEEEARVAGLGIHDLPEECSVDKQAASLSSQTTTLLATSVLTMSAADVDAHEKKVMALLSTARTLLRSAETPSDFERAAFDGYKEQRRDIANLITELQEREESLDVRRDTIAEEEQAARAAEAERVRLEEERRQQEQREAEQHQRERVAPAPVPAPAPAPAPQPAPSGGGGGKYTGCRAYGGNYALTSIDEKGRRYAKIDCATKVQIG